jgi:hypothetical protein
MWQSVLAMGACTSGLLSPSTAFNAISFLQWGQLAGCIVILTQLQAIEDSRIDRDHARTIIDLPVLLGRVVDKLTTTAANENTQEQSVYIQLASGISELRSTMPASTGEPSQPSNNHLASRKPPLCGGTHRKFWMNSYFDG